MKEEEPSSPLGHMPLWWLLLPQITGYCAARFLIPQSSTLLLASLALLSLLMGVVILKTEKPISLKLWALSFFSGICLLSASYFSHHQPPKLEAENYAPREATITLDIARVLSEKKDQHGLSGYATIVGTPAHLEQFKQQRIYIKTLPIPKPSDDLPIIRGSIIEAQGLFEFISQDIEKEDSFDYFLKSNGFSHKLTRAKVISIKKHGSLFHHWCYAMNKKLQHILHLGAEHEIEHTFASVEIAMMLGKRDTLKPEQKEQYRASGTMHLFAISGLHVGVIIVSIMSVLKLMRVPMVAATFIGLSTLFLYVEIIGATPSAVRALIMSVLYYGAYLVKRKPSTLSALLGSAIIVLILDPNQLFSVGFQLSYTVVGGILIYALPLITRLRERSLILRFTPVKDLNILKRFFLTSLTPKIRSLFCISLTAFLFGAPLTGSYFNILTPGAILLNMVLLPLATLGIISGLATLISGLLHLSFLAVLFNHASWMLLLAMDVVLKQSLKLSTLFFHYTSDTLSGAFLYLAILFGFLLTLHSYQKQHTWYFFLTPFAFFFIWLMLG